MLILQESLGCNKLQLAACLRWNNGSHAAAIRSLALATRNVTTPLTVEYLTPANDASGRLYATQISAQKLPRDLRLLIYGSTHKEVDLTGAHYELIRALTGSVTLPPTRLLTLTFQCLCLAATWGVQMSNPRRGRRFNYEATKSPTMATESPTREANPLRCMPNPLCTGQIHYDTCQILSDAKSVDLS